MHTLRVEPKWSRMSRGIHMYCIYCTMIEVKPCHVYAMSSRTKSDIQKAVCFGRQVHLPGVLPMVGSMLALTIVPAPCPVLLQARPS